MTLRLLNGLILVLMSWGLSLPGTRAATPDFPPPLDTNHVISVELQMVPTDWKTLRYQHREAEFFPEAGGTPPTNAYTWFKAEAKIDGRSVGPVEVRKKGYIGSNDTKRPGLKLRLAPSSKTHSSHRIPELTLNNNAQDPALIRQTLAYEVFRRANVPAPMCGFAQVTVNGVALGTYTRVESVDSFFLERNFPQTGGNLYEGGRSDFRTGWYQNFEPKGHATNSQFGDLRAATEAIERTTGSLLPVLDQFFDTEEFYRFWAIESLLNEGDGYSANMNNFFVYHRPDTGKFVFIPWGADASFNRGRGMNATRGDPKSVIATAILPNRLFQSKEGAEHYRATLADVLSKAWNESLLLSEINRLDKLLSPFEKERTADWTESVEAIRRFVSGRRAELASELQGPIPELKSKPLEIAKRRNVGQVTAHLSAFWNVNSPDASALAEATNVSVKLWDQELKLKSAQLQASGLADNPTADQQPQIVLSLETENHEQLIVYLQIDLETYLTDRIIPIDNTHIFGGVVQADARGQGSKMIGMLRGRLFLTSASSKPGGKVEGDLKADIFSKLPKP